MFNLDDKKTIKKLISILVLLLIFDIFIWSKIFKSNNYINEQAFYFFNVGQGDSEMIKMQGNIKVLIDGGPSNKILDQLPLSMDDSDKYIDIVMLTHPHSDHFNGLIEVLKRYKIGLFVYNGLNPESPGFNELKKVIKEKNIKTIILKEKDQIKFKDDIFKILSPNDNELLQKDLNDTSISFEFISSQTKAFFGGDITKKVEQRLAQTYSIKSDILKISHHGSKGSLLDEFINSIDPKIAIAEVGKNSYGHPAPIIIEKIQIAGAKVFRTDKDGLIKIIADNGKLNIFKQN